MVPGGALLAAAVVALHFRLVLLPEAVVQFCFFAAFAAALLLAWRFHASRLALAAVVIFGAALALRTFGSPAPSLFNVLCLLLPLNFLALALTPERGFAGATCGAWLGTLFSEAVAVMLVTRANGAQLLGREFLAGAALRWTRLPPLALLAFALAAAVLLARCTLRPRAADAGLFWGLLACLAALHAGGGSRGALAYFATAGVVLVAAVIEASYFLAYHDELTALPSRRAFNQQLLALDGRFAIAMVDVDHFKKFNDLFGHDTGDQVLRLAASRLAGVSGGGRAFRCGGEEFAVVFPGRSLRAAYPHLEQVRAAVEETVFTVRRADRRQRTKEDRIQGTQKDRRATRRMQAERDVRVTVSIGVAEPSRAWATPEGVLTAADQALYRAKAGGRNRVEPALPRRPKAESEPLAAAAGTR